MTAIEDQPEGMGLKVSADLFAPPMDRPGHILRLRLLSEEGSDRVRPVMVVVAPAGYGKSTFAAQWCRSDQRSVAWLSLRDADNDAVRLLRRLTEALEGLEPIDAELLETLNRPTSQIDSVLLPRFLDDLRRRIPFQLVLDDADFVNTPAATRALKGLADAVPVGSQLILITRSELPVGLARIRAAGDLHEVGTTDLALDEDETRQLLAVAGLDLSAEEVNEIWTITEGWAAGLTLAVIACRRDGQPSPLTSISGTRRDIADYFREEVLATEPEDIRKFLLTTSIVQRLSGALCDAMTGRGDSSRLLSELAATNLFVIPLDDHQHWFRYHHLFQDLLQGELDRAPELSKTDLYERAAAWHEAHGDPGEAFEYARCSHDFDRLRLNPSWPLAGV